MRRGYGTRRRPRQTELAPARSAIMSKRSSTAEATLSHSSWIAMNPCPHGRISIGTLAIDERGLMARNDLEYRERRQDLAFWPDRPGETLLRRDWASFEPLRER
jgi:hypothetical protein